MSGVLDDLEFDIPCPSCEKEFTISKNQIGKSVSCPHCNETIHLKDDGIIDGLADVENQLESMLDIL